GGMGGGRYPIGFSGDTWSVWESLAFQPEFTSTAANVLYGYWSHDIGGHYGPTTTPELYTRWLQFGIYSPILRTHATKHPEQERRFWEFSDPYRSTMNATVRRRYEMAPYIYTECRRAVSTGLSIVRPLYYEHPRADAAYEAKSQYQFGDSFIVAPVLAPIDSDMMAPVRVWLPKGKYYDTAHGSQINVRSAKGEWHERRYLLDEIPVFAKAGAIIPGLKGANRLGVPSYENLIITAYPGGDGDYELYEDDGVSQRYIDGDSVSIPLSQRLSTGVRTIEIGPAQGGYRGWLRRKPVEVRIVHEAPPLKVLVNGVEIAMATSADGRIKPSRPSNPRGGTSPVRAERSSRSTVGSGRGANRDARPRDYWYYDAASASVVISLVQVDLTKSTTITSHRNPTLPKNVERLLDGYPGLARRLDAISQRAGLSSASAELHPEERLAVDLAQAANRITRDPSTLVEELRRTRREFSRLDEIFEVWQTKWHSALKFPFSNQEAVAVEMLEEARRILATTTGQFGS
ncbi:MAG TPA: TIM-barrel domain-containing protein, partial [Microthrixaceae bacterium]|nr:TIM-barrel domain-containing protein [Microthrixaceae bacterium]